MAALNKERNTLESIGHIRAYPVKATAKCYAGSIGVLSAGYMQPAAVATGLLVVGRIEDSCDNTLGIDGDVIGTAREGVFAWDNSTSADLITQAEVGKDCYLIDDHTVAKTDGTGTRSRAGKVVAVDGKGVWVKMGLGV